MAVHDARALLRWLAFCLLDGDGRDESALELLVLGVANNYIVQLAIDTTNILRERGACVVRVLVSRRSYDHAYERVTTTALVHHSY